MLYHIVLLKLKKETTKSQIDAFYTNICGLKDEIPGIISVDIGPNISIEDKQRGYEIGFVMKFEDSDARDNYVPHPKHREVGKKYVRPIAEKEGVLVFDLETTS